MGIMYLLWISATLLLLEVTDGSFTTVAQNITECKNLTCAHNSTCKTTLDKGEYCTCTRGYQGNSCNKDVDECHLGDPCGHRGNCVNSFGSYKCVCLAGWTGENAHCEVKLNNTNTHECKPGYLGKWCQDQCLNDSMCLPNQVCVEKHGYAQLTERQRGHYCRCAQGWFGVNCTNDKDECADTKSPCPTNKTCLNTPGSYNCICLPGWTGVNCTEDIDECSPNPCKKIQTCNNTPGSYECHCNAGWNGTNCDVDIDECKSSPPPCLNAGTCLNTNGSYHCKCSSGWTGRNCNNDVDECMSSPCSVRQTCNNTLGSYECQCKRGWNGSKCDVDINECLASPCLNTGNCVNTNGSYYCNCTSGWQGDNCEDDIDECDENPCNGTLTCTNSLGSYSCSNGQTRATDSGNTDARKTYIIVGSVLGAFLLLCCIVAFVYIWKKKKKRNGTRVSTLNGNEKFNSKNNQVPTSN